jgi:nitrogen fixation protein NifQ
MSYYTETIRKWATDTRRTGSIQDADGVGEVGLEAHLAGRRLAARFSLKVNLGRVADARYEVFGCGFSMAACAVAADLSIGYPLEKINEIDARRLGSALDGLPAERHYCAELAVDALRAAAASARSGRKVVSSVLNQDVEHGPRVRTDAHVYSYLMQTPQPDAVLKEDRHLFACLMTVAAQESKDFAAVLGLEDCALDSLMSLFFPGLRKDVLLQHSRSSERNPSECNDEVLSILLSHVPEDNGSGQYFISLCLAKVIAARTALPGHLWVAMGLTERPQLTAAIRRHLPSLARANHMNMRWKRYLYKQVCVLNGGVMCKAPNCGVCSDYNLCFAEEDSD